MCSLSLFAGPASEARVLALCKFDTASLEFQGSKSEQARCLLRPVKKFAHVGDVLIALPVPLAGIVGQSNVISREKLRAYLAAKGIRERDLGGSLDSSVSRGSNGAVGAPLARYFVIHDTSSPNCSARPRQRGCGPRGEFPADINAASSPINDLDRILAAGSPAHIFVNRPGQSVTVHDFKDASRATKMEKNANAGFKSRGLFLHVELIQPRIGQPAVPSGGRVNDAIAPDPGFTDAQYARLALLYAAASTRRGEWLVPGYHCTIDSGFADGHDDPQKFELEKWMAALAALIAETGGS